MKRWLEMEKEEDAVKPWQKLSEHVANEDMCRC